MMGRFNSMTGRVFLVVAAGVLVSALVTLFLARQGVEAQFGRLNTQRVVDRVQNAVLTLERDPNARERYFVPDGSPDGLNDEENGGRPGRGGWVRGLGLRIVPRLAERDIRGRRDEALTQALAQNLDASYAPEAFDLDFARCGLPRPPPDAPRPPQCRLVRLTLHDGARVALVVMPPREPQMPGGGFPGALILLFAVLAGGVAFFGAWLAVTPMRRFAREAEALGQNIDRPALAEAGPFETRRVVRALNEMQARIQAHLRERTSLLAAISHDLRTPLTRMRLRIEKIANEGERKKMIADVAAMESLIAQGLDLARGGVAPEPVQKVNLKSLLQAAEADAAEAGGDVRLEAAMELDVLARPHALTRCIANLIENAIKHGGYARISARREEDKAVVRVRDGGPGIAPSDMETAFEPFTRLGNAGGHGAGLGLSIARAFARQNGGDLSLRNHPEGGLEAILTLGLAG